VNLTLFTVEEANALLPRIEPKLRGLSELKREYNGRRRHAEVLDVASSGATDGNPDTVALRAEEDRLKRLAERIRSGVGEIHGHGCLVKDLDQGLVDFYALSGDRLIFLCWHLGEAEVAHWHPLEGGFTSRQPLNHTELD